MTTPFLHNMAWHSLVGPQAGCAAGRDGARRYAPGFSPILGFADPQHPDFAGLARCCEPGEHFYCDTWRGAAPDGWRIDMESTMFRMVWQGGVPDDEVPEAVALGPSHAAQAVELATLTKPGPFGPRTPELGEYYGCFVDGRLVAMAGERMHAAPLREISGVCTHPDYQGHGLARRLMLKLARRQMLRGETPFLHVMSGNTGARRLYEHMGFDNYREVVVRVVCPV